MKHSPWPEYAEDIIATSGFAFRMWVTPDLCPSATSLWAFAKQPVWVASGGLDCAYTERLWDADAVEEQRRLAAVAQIKQSIDRGIPAVSWDIGVPEWGLLTGYNDATQTFSTLAINGAGEMAYDALGKRELPILSVLTVTGANGKPPADMLKDTMRLTADHLQGREWCENAKGLDAYPALIKHFEADFNLDAWLTAFQIKTREDVTQPEARESIASLLNSAHESEKQAVAVMSERANRP